MRYCQGQWEECDAPGQPGCVAYQGDDTTSEEIAWHCWPPGNYHLQPTSPCIDTGTSEGAPTTDIEGNARPCWYGIDMGAYEYCGDEEPNPTLPQFNRGDPNADANLDIADAVFTLSYFFASGPAPSCLDAADANDDGAVDIADAIAVLTHLFGGGGTLPEPFGQCGIDPTIDGVGCASFEPCAGP